MEIDNSDVSSDREEAIRAMIEEGNYWPEFDEWVDDMDEDHIGNEQLGGNGIVDHLNVVPFGRMHSDTYRLTFERYKVTVRNMYDVPFEETVTTMLSILQHILDVVLDTVSDHDFVRLRIETRSLDIPIWTPPVLKSELTLDRWMLEVQKVLNSQEEFKFDDSFNIIVSYASPSAGNAFDKLPHPLKDRLARSTSIVTIENSDEICMVRAIVVDLALAEGNRKEYKKLCDRRLTHQKVKASQLIEKAGSLVRTYSIADIPSFEAVRKISS